MRYENKLDPRVIGSTRYGLITSYQKVYNTTSLPSGLHPALDVDLPVKPVEGHATWVYNVPGNSDAAKKLRKSAEESAGKRKADGDVEGLISTPRKKHKPDHNLEHAPAVVSRLSAVQDVQRSAAKKRTSSNAPTLSKYDGPLWQGSRMTCGYDSVLAIVFSILKDDRSMLADSLSGMNNLWGPIVASWREYVRTSDHGLLDQARDTFHASLREINATLFTHEGTDIQDIEQYLFRLNARADAVTLTCSRCNGEQDMTGRSSLSNVINIDRANKTKVLAKRLEAVWKSEIPNVCASCRYRDTLQRLGPVIPASASIFGVNIQKQDFRITCTMKVGRERRMILRGVVYHGANHFISRIVCKTTRRSYLYDGMDGRGVLDEGPFAQLANSSRVLWKGELREAALLIYTFE